MTQRRAYVIWTHPLFHEAVRLLLGQSRVALVGASSDHATARTQIAALKPDVVIVEQANDELQAVEETVAFLHAGSRVIRLSLADNELVVYKRERRTVGTVEDLVSLIESAPDRDDALR